MIWKLIPTSPVPGCEAWVEEKLKLTVIVGKEPLGPRGALRWHLSISNPRRYPTWDEIFNARYRFVPEMATMAMFLPPHAEYINLHRNCFHLFEIYDADELTPIVTTTAPTQQAPINPGSTYGS